MHETHTGGICRGGDNVINDQDFWRNDAPERSRRKIGRQDLARSRRLIRWGLDFGAVHSWDLPAHTILSGRQRVLDARRRGE